MKSVFIVGGGGGGYTDMFQENGWVIVPSIEEAEFVQFTGGEDVSPELYGEKNVASHNSQYRDAKEIGAFNKAKEQGKKLLGICRGGQFLTVMSGHKLWQDVDNHGIWGTHKAKVVATGEQVDVTSTHHQMFRATPDNPFEILVVAGLTTYKENDEDIYGQDLEDDQRDLESVFYPHTNALAFQPHPEMTQLGHPCQKLFFDLIDQKFA